MNLQVDVEHLLFAQKTVRAELLAERADSGHWVGQLCGSPYATAAAVSALVASHHSNTTDALRRNASGDTDQATDHLVQGDLSEFLLESVNWLARHQNSDGGWGDCVGGRSNIAATLLVLAAFRLTGLPAKYHDLLLRADQYVNAHDGMQGLRRELREDRFRRAAILTACAVAGIVPWRQVPTLRFEQACLPTRWQSYVQLPLHRISLPLLLAIGRAKFHHDPPRNPLTRLWRRSVQSNAISRLEQLQAADDSFLASVSTTAFVIFGLSSIGCQDHPIVHRGVEFLLASARGDSSWSEQYSFDTTVTAHALENLAETHQAVVDGWQDTATTDDTVTERHGHAEHLHEHGVNDAVHPGEAAYNDRCLDWLLAAQRTDGNAVTGAAAGGWASSDAYGALPNAADTGAVLLAIAAWPNRDRHPQRERMARAVRVGIAWLLDLQNDDGSWPTFNRGASGFEPDASGPDVAATVLRALGAWSREWRSESQRGRDFGASELGDRIHSAIQRGWRYLESCQRPDGSFVPLWFGNEHRPDDINLVIGTSLVLLAAAELGRTEWDMAARAARWLVSAQHSGGGWGPPRLAVDYSTTEKDGLRARKANEAMAKSSSVEETALAVRALMPWVGADPAAAKAASAGLSWLTAVVERETPPRPAVIGFYPTKIWYHDRLYPLVFTAGALASATQQLAVERPATAPVS